MARLRRIEVGVEERQEILVLLSNHLSFGPSTIADRSLLSLFEAEPAHQDLCGHQRQRVAHSDLDSTDCHLAAEIFATAGSLRMVAIKSGRSAAPTTICLSRFTSLAG
jgi:hypothetical protein